MLGYPFAKQLLARQKPFTALFAYNDISAIGAIRAIQEQGLRVPQDISVIGFDDIPGAAFNNPSLTTVRQPLEPYGRGCGPKPARANRREKRVPERDRHRARASGP